MKKFMFPVLAFACFATPVFAQQDSTTAINQTAPAPNAAAKPRSEVKFNLSEDGSKYLKATFLNQVWLRWNESNSGTLVNSQPQKNTVDIGLRRTRMQLFGQLTDHVFFYTQFGMNNFNFLSAPSGNRKLQAFFHDALGEYKFFKDNDKLKIGGGLTIVSGLSRFSQPSVGTIMTTDVPVFLQATNDQTDEFSRKLSIYARGQLGKFDYRIALSDPFPIQTNGAPAPALTKDVANFATMGHTKQYQGFFMYNFLEKEPNVLPYMTGTYLGDKKILNLEGGLIYQKSATWHKTAAADTVYNNMALWSVAAFADMPILNNKYAISAYAGYFSTDYGKNYLRNAGTMNPANGNSNPANFNGAGNAYPVFGTGSSVYAQFGLRLPKDLFGENGTLMPYISYRRANLDRLNDAVNVWDGGVNWLLNKHQSKLSLNYQLRPEFKTQTDGNIVKNINRSAAWLQYQVSF